MELYYNPYTLAYFIVANDIGTGQSAKILDEIFEKEKMFLHPDFRNDKLEFVKNTMQQIHAFSDQESLDAEYMKVEKDFQGLGKEFLTNDAEYADVGSFFMYLRLRLLYLQGQDHVRLKLRTLLEQYGYRRRTKKLMEHIRDCMMFYHIRSYLRGKEECDIREIDLDDMIVFREM